MGRGIGQGATSLFGAAADTAAGLSQLYVDTDMLAGNPELVQQADAHVNAALAKASAGHLFESRVGTAAYDLADTLKADPSNTTTVDQVVQGAVSGLTQIVPAAVLGGPFAGAAVGGTAIGMGRAEDLKRQGVDVGTRTAAGGVEGAIGGVGAVLPVAGSTLARTAALVGIGGPGMSIVQGAAEKAILRNANYDGLADQINPLDPVNLAASTLVAGVFGGVHVALGARAAAAAAAGPGVPLTDMSVATRKALPYNSPALDAYATQAAQAAGVPPSFLLFIKNQGERSNSNQVSSAGAKGVMQFTKDTWGAYGNGDPTDPVNSINAAAAYAKDLLQRYNGDMRAAVTEYNGGVEQARAVQAGGAPTAQETIDYLHRFDQFAATHAIDSATFSPTGDQVDAALKAQGQRIVDDAHVFGTPDDLTSTSAHQAAFEAAAQQMAAGRFPDVSSFVSGDDASRASALDGMINDAEASRADLVQQASQLAERGGVTDARAELASLQATPPVSFESDPKTLTRQIQSTGVKFKAAAKRAEKQIEAQRQEYADMVQDHADKIQRLQQIIQRNAEAQRANDAIAGVDQQLGKLRAARDQIDVPQTTRRPLADFVQRLATVEREPTPVSAAEGSMAGAATSPNDAGGAEPPLAPGFVRLYHGGQEFENPTGRWVAPGDRRYAEGYAAKSGAAGHVFYHDIPESDPRLMKTFDDEGTDQKAPYAFFELRDAEAAGMRRLDDGAARTDGREVITRASLAENGSVNLRKAAAAIEQRVRAALLEGRDVTLSSEGALHRIVGFEKGMVDSAGKNWTAMDLLRPPRDGEAPSLEIGAPPDAAPATGSVVESNLRKSAAENPDRRVTLDAPVEGSDFSSANPRTAAFDGPLQDALDLIDREHSETVSGANLFRVAAQCFLSLGG
ncbi:MULTISPECIES: transglycosylase SLT domain-containing protein [unclassified Paraburkholderia]|uniref:transglycosylase SLT domain-containing protein n=1 Tax=unclassified Paraburkholderia TaxID=2615204 RepID=UPI002AB1C608|nr:MULTISPECIES: transglycosylase SLT domain-containing protein [unclassified Paraburkholderia]